MNKCWYCGNIEVYVPEPPNEPELTQDLCEDCAKIHGLIQDIAEQYEIDAAWDNPFPVLPHERES